MTRRLYPDNNCSAIMYKVAWTTRKPATESQGYDTFKM